MTRIPARTARALAVCALLVAGLGAGAGVAPPAHADGLPPQVLDRDEPTVDGPVVLDEGHIDIGPRYRDGTWSIQLHTGAGADAVWRRPADVVLHVTPAARQTVPDDPAYVFLHADPGAAVSVIPQTQQRDVVWVGWNTQDPAAMEVMDQGATMALRGVQGPGSLVVYLQSGDLGDPQVLWDSTRTGDQGIFVDTNTHTHANWVFSAPGTYLVDMQITSTLVDGSTVTDAEPIRFVVGDQAEAGDPAAALSAVYDESASAPAAAAAPTAAAGDVDPGDGSLDASVLAVVLGAGAGLVLLVVALVVALLVRSARARRRVLAERSARDADGTRA